MAYVLQVFFSEHEIDGGDKDNAAVNTDRPCHCNANSDKARKCDLNFAPPVTLCMLPGIFAARDHSVICKPHKYNFGSISLPPGLCFVLAGPAPLSSNQQRRTRQTWNKP